MTREFNNIEEIQKYYNKKTNTYIFKENGEYIEFVIFHFNLDVDANIDAFTIIGRDITALNIEASDIIACDIKVKDIYADNIEADNIKATNIIYLAVCFAYNTIKCKSITGRYRNAKHFVLDGKLEIEELDGKLEVK